MGRINVTSGFFGESSDSNHSTKQCHVGGPDRISLSRTTHSMTEQTRQAQPRTESRAAHCCKVSNEAAVQTEQDVDTMCAGSKVMQATAWRAHKAEEAGGCARDILLKLTWLPLGGDPTACSRRVEQFTALRGL